MQTHIVPVGFDYDRVIAPLVREQMNVDRAILLEGDVGSEANVEYSRRLAKKLEQDFQNLLGASTERYVIEDVYDYDGAFEQAFLLINDELDRERAATEGNEVWVNISAMPRTVSFAFATAAHSIMVEREEDRDRIHTYYTVPEKYLETELAEELRSQISLLEDLSAGTALSNGAVATNDESTSGDPIEKSSGAPIEKSSGAPIEGSSGAPIEGSSGAPIEGTTVDRIEARLASARQLLSEFDERGTTIGAKEVGGSHIVELPVASFSNVDPFEEIILFTLGEHGEFESVSELAQQLARELGEEYTNSFRSKVIYTVDRLGPGGTGYIEQEKHGKSYRTRLSRIGKLWVRSHSARRSDDRDGGDIDL